MRALKYLTSDLTVCSIVSLAFMPAARVMLRSFLEFHPGARAALLVLDANLPTETPIPGVRVFTLSEIVTGDLTPYRFGYTPFELSCWAKPRLLNALLAEGHSCCIYLDADILVLSRFDEVLQMLERHSIVLTPHLTSLSNESSASIERELFASGAYNMGFLTIRDDESAKCFLKWWGHRTDTNCFHDIKSGLFVDQKWIDLVPGGFSNVGVLRHRGYNCAYWNLGERAIGEENCAFMVGTDPLRFFHFSGYEGGDKLSRHSEIAVDALPPTLKKLVREYFTRLQLEGWPAFLPSNYAFDRYTDGSAIEAIDRRAYWKVKDALPLGDPFSSSLLGDFLHLYRACDGDVTRACTLYHQPVRAKLYVGWRRAKALLRQLILSLLMKRQSGLLRQRDRSLGAK